MSPRTPRSGSSGRCRARGRCPHPTRCRRPRPPACGTARESRCRGERTAHPFPVRLLAVAQRQFHVLSLRGLERHAIAAVGVQYHLFRIFHGLPVLPLFYLFISSSLRSALVPLTVRLATACASCVPPPVCGIPRVVADQHHGEERPGDLAQPAEASEDEQGRRDQPAMLSPDTLPRPRLRKKPPSMLHKAAAGGSRRKFDTPFSSSLRRPRRRLLRRPSLRLCSSARARRRVRLRWRSWPILRLRRR